MPLHVSVFKEWEMLRLRGVSLAIRRISSLLFFGKSRENIRPQLAGAYKRQEIKMRLFIAINFSNEIKGKLADAQDALRKHALSGNFTRTENLHLTLIFLGETPQNRLETIKQAIDSIQEKAFELRANGSGRFSRNGGDIWWIGMEENHTLKKIHSVLADSLTASGFDIEEREFKPHLTLARKVLLKNEKNIPKITGSFNIVVDKISLMKSEQIKGTLTYTEIYSKVLNG